MKQKRQKYYSITHWTQYKGLRVSIDGKGRAKDNIRMERFRRSIKYDYIYLNPS